MAESVVKLRVDSHEYDAKIKRATEGLRAFGENCQKAGQSVAKADKETIDYVRAIGQMDTVTKSAKGKIGELTRAFTDMSVQYNRLTAQEKQSPFGKALSQSLDQLKTRIHESKREIDGIENSLKSSKGGVSGLSSVLGELGGKLGMNSQLTGVLTTGTIGMTAAITAGAAATVAAAKAWSDYNTELAKSQQDVSVITGLKGQDADEMTAGIRALVKTYGVDFREAVSAANTLMQQFGVSGENAFNLLRDGMQGMLQGDAPKLLSMIQQYAPAFRDAGVEASQLVAVIQNSEGGLFTDENMNAIVMGIKNIRLMTDKTSESLAKLGIDGSDMTRKLNEGTLTVFDALKQVSEAIEGVGSGSQTAGEVMQQVFGRQGTAAGTKLGDAIASLNLNLEDTKLQTGSVGESLDELVDANMRLEKAMADCFGFDGWTQMSNSIRATLLTTLADVITAVSSVKEELWAAYKLTLSLIPGGSVVNGIMGISGSGGGTSSTGGGGGSVGGGGGGVRGIAEAHTAATIPIRLGGGGGGGRRISRSSGGGRTGGGHSTHKETPAERAQKLVDNALANYAKTISMADMMLENGMINSQDYKKKELAAQERLTTAYAEAYNVYNDEKYKTAFEDAATEYRDLADVVKGKREEFEKATEQLAGMSVNPIDGILNQLLGESMEDYAKRKNIDLNTGKGGGKKSDWAEQTSKNIDKYLSPISTISSGLQEMGVKVPEGIERMIAITQGVSTILTGISAILTLIEASTQIAAAASVSNAIIPFARGGVAHAAGGIVAGHYFSGDQVPAMLNSGEVVLNRAQAGVIADALGGGGSPVIQIEGRITGEDIELVQRNRNRRTGRGEYITTKMR